MATQITCDRCGRIIKATERKYTATARMVGASTEAGLATEWQPSLTDVCVPCIQQMFQPVTVESLRDVLVPTGTK